MGMLVALVSILGVLGSCILAVGMNKGEEKQTKLGCTLLSACASIAIIAILPVVIIKGIFMIAIVTVSSIAIQKI